VIASPDDSAVSVIFQALLVFAPALTNDVVDVRMIPPRDVGGRPADPLAVLHYLLAGGNVHQRDFVPKRDR